GQGQRANVAGAFIRCPEADERAERESVEDAVAFPDAGAAEDMPPAVGPPLPGCLGIQPSDRRLAGGPRGLVELDVPLQWIGEVGPERRLALLVLGQLALCGKRQLVEVLPGTDTAIEAERGRVKAVVGQQHADG